MSSRADSKTASQFAYLTMRLKDKLHPPRIRRTERIKHSPSQRSKPPDLNLQEDSLHKGGLLADQQRAVVSSLQYFKALVDRLGLDKPGVNKLVLDQSVVGGLLGGASGRVLEAVQTLVQLEPHLHNSKTVSACLTRLYQSLAELIRWADQVMLQGVTHDDKESTVSVTTVIRAVLDGVKDLVRLAAERQEGSSSLSPVQSQPPDQETLGRTSTCRTPAAPEEEEEEEEEKGVWMERRREEQTVSAPPKPLMPLPLGLSPPALPPKKRQSLPSSVPCRVAIVAPMRREPETESQDCEDDDCLKRCSSSSAESAADNNTHCEEDPDYDFLHTDLSSSETLPLLPPSSSLPPALPEKRRRSTAGVTSSQSPPSFEFDPASQKQNPAHSDDVTDPDEPLSSPLSPSKTPPPLPEKKRHIHQYLQVCSSYSAQSAAMFYQRPPTFGQSYRQREVDTTHQLTHTHLDADSAPSPELPPAPALPPKKKQQDSAEDDKQTSVNQNRDSSQSFQQEEEEHGGRSREEQEEVLLTDQQEILHRITMKPEEEEGPDVKAASPEILLVYATETDSSTGPSSARATSSANCSTDILSADWSGCDQDRTGNLNVV